MANRYSIQIDELNLYFKKPAETSRGVLNNKPSFIFEIKDNYSNISGRGECSLIPGLNPESTLDAKDTLWQIKQHFENSDVLFIPKNIKFPSVIFCIETALLTLSNGGNDILFPNAFTQGKKGILINGLIWMNDPQEMWENVKKKVSEGYNCIKLKVGHHNFKTELELLSRIRQEYGNELEIRLDANGAFSTEDAFSKLDKLSKYNIHSIEQPIKAGQHEYMTELCKYSVIPIALDEELIGIKSTEEKEKLLNIIRPHYVILKPSLIGGFSESNDWIRLCDLYQCGWWATSALESNIGLNAIAQWVGDKNTSLAQGLGTGSLYVNNIPLPISTKGNMLWHD